MVQAGEPPRLTRVKPPVLAALPEKPEQRGPLTDLKHEKLSGNIEWLIQAVQALDGGCQVVTGHVREAIDVNKLLDERIKEVEAGVRACMKRIDEIPPPQIVEQRSLEPEVVEQERDEVLGLLDEDNTGAVKRKKLFDYFYKLGFAKQAEVETLVKGCVEELRKEIEPKLQDHTDQLKMIRTDVGKRLLITTFDANKAEMQARLKAMDDLHDEDVRIREQMMSDHEALVVRHEKLQEDVLDLEARHAKRLDACEEFERDLAKRIADFRERLDEHDEQFDLMEQLRQKQAKQKVGPVTVDSFSHVALEDEIRRLRSMVECMEQALGADVKKTMEFFKHAERIEGGGGRGGGAAAGQTASQTGSADGGVATVSQLQNELTEQVQQCREIVIRDQEKMFKALGTMQRDSEILDAKMDDMWRRLPKVIALLEPLKIDGKPSTKAPMDATALSGSVPEGGEGANGDGATAADARAEMQALTNMMRGALQGAFDELRESVQMQVHGMREDFQRTSEQSKAEMAALTGRLDSWNDHFATRRQRSVERGESAMMKDMRSLSPARPKENPDSCHNRTCKTPTEPAAAALAQKEGRLPKPNVTGSTVTA
eukprot:TRINITY_DN9664_c0_g1_i2.p1 TRINITY_DN9664_c0_g1~~TRINITY_DN9664_c0_g1_i2.p1  ORF type:complete len:599 (-),score=200.63 TRINITY_DN9664_c0_g1_i2:84-1880(-)